MYFYTENTTVLIDGNPNGNDVFVSHSGNGMTKEDITMQCNITVPGSAVNITWFHNGERNHSLSTASVLFPRNSHVSTIAGTYVCAASTSNWEARVQFRILLKRKPNVLALVLCSFVILVVISYCDSVIWLHGMDVSKMLWIVLFVPICKLSWWSLSATRCRVLVGHCNLHYSTIRN